MDTNKIVGSSGVSWGQCGWFCVDALKKVVGEGECCTISVLHQHFRTLILAVWFAIPERWISHGKYGQLQWRKHTHNDVEITERGVVECGSSRMEKG